MKITKFNITLTLVVISMTGIMTSCSTLKQKRILAIVDNEMIYEEDINKKIPSEKLADKKGLYDIQKKLVTEMVVEKLLKKEANKNNITVSELLAKNVFKKMKPIKKSELKAYYKKREKELGNLKFKDVEALLKDTLYRERRRDLLATYYNDLIITDNVRLFLTEPHQQ